MIQRIALLVLLIVSFATPTFAKRYAYSDLITLDLEEMEKKVQSLVKKVNDLPEEAEEETDLVDDEESGSQSGTETSAKDKEAIEALRGALRFILTRPDRINENMVSKLMPLVRGKLVNYSAFEDTLASLTNEAISGLQQKQLKPIYRATYMFMLENIMTEIQKEAVDKPEFERIIKKIRDAKIEIADDVKSELKMRTTFAASDPSAIADEILKRISKEKKKLQAKAAQQNKDNNSEKTKPSEKD